MSISTDGGTTFSALQSVDPTPAKTGPVCTAGINCSSDRQLGDFQQLTLDFDERGEFEHHHYAFKISEAEFDAIFARVKVEAIAYGSGPRSRADMQINRRNGGRGFYFEDPNGHVLEVLNA